MTVFIIIISFLLLLPHQVNPMEAKFFFFFQSEVGCRADGGPRSLWLVLFFFFSATTTNIHIGSGFAYIHEMNLTPQMRGIPPPPQFFILFCSSQVKNK